MVAIAGTTVMQVYRLIREPSVAKENFLFPNQLPKNSLRLLGLLAYDCSHSLNWSDLFLSKHCLAALWAVVRLCDMWLKSKSCDFWNMLAAPLRQNFYFNKELSLFLVILHFFKFYYKCQQSLGSYWCITFFANPPSARNLQESEGIFCSCCLW